jgi:hypothetical protein
MIIVHFYIVNYTTPIFADIILEKAANCKNFLLLVWGKIDSFNCIELIIHLSIEDLRYSCSRNTKISG